jgi:hypothetical protein
MQFVHPAFLFALSAIAIPIIIHLFNFRRFKRVFFSNVKFLREIKEQTSSRSRLRHLLTLTTRILAIAFLVFAFAQPFVPGKESQDTGGVRSVSVYVDNSFSMSAFGDQAALIEQAKDKAREIANAYNATDRFNLLTGDFEGRHQRMISRDEFMLLIDEVQESPVVRRLSQVRGKQSQMLAEEDNAVSFIISDFQKSVTDIEADSSVYLVKLEPTGQKNLSIDSCWLDAPVQLLNQSRQLFVRISNRGDNDADELPLNLNINDKHVAVGNFSVPANTTITDTLFFTVNDPGWNKAEVAITDYPVSFDDRWFMSFDVIDKLRVLVITDGRPSPYFAALDSIGFMAITQFSAGQVNYSAFPTFQLIVLDQVARVSTGLASELQAYVEKGGQLLLFPGTTADISSYNALLASLGAGSFGALNPREKRIARFNQDNRLFKEVFDELPENVLLPTARQSFDIANPVRSGAEDLVFFADGSTFLSICPSGRGNVFQAACPPNADVSDLPVHSLFVLMVAQTASAGGVSEPLSYTIDSDPVIEVDNVLESSDQVFRVRSEGTEFLPEQRPLGSKVLLNMHEQIRQAGTYEITLPNSDFSKFVSFNYDRRESDLATLSKAELEVRYGQSGVAILDGSDQSLQASIVRISSGIHLWKLCIIIALAFLAIEVLLLRLLP